MRIPAVPNVDLAKVRRHRARSFRPYMTVIRLAVRVAVPGAAVSFPLLGHDRENGWYNGRALPPAPMRATVAPMQDSDLDPVMSALGRAVWAAQFFEMMLGSTLIALIIAKGDRSKFADEGSARAWLAKLDGLTLGAVRSRIAQLKLLPDHMVTAIAEVNQRRNEVVHHFMNQWSDRMDDAAGLESAIDYLDESAEGFLSTARRLQSGVERMREMGLTEWKDPT